MKYRPVLYIRNKKMNLKLFIKLIRKLLPLNFLKSFSILKRNILIMIHVSVVVNSLYLEIRDRRKFCTLGPRHAVSW